MARNNWQNTVKPGKQLRRLERREMAKRIARIQAEMAQWRREAECKQAGGAA